MQSFQRRGQEGYGRKVYKRRENRVKANVNCAMFCAFSSGKAISDE